MAVVDIKDSVLGSLTADDVCEFLNSQVADCGTQWSIGTFGALAEFSREASEQVRISRCGHHVTAVTGRGALSIHAHSDLCLVATESPTRESWSHRIALCLPHSRSAMSRRQVLTELGPDRDAVREEDRESLLFDLGLGTWQVDACIRVADPSIVRELRLLSGQGVFEPGNPAMGIIVPHGPHRVFVSRIGRLEVFQPIPLPGGRSPEGPHTHVLSKLLRTGRTHPTTEQIPDGLVPCGHLYPPHPTKDGAGRPLPFDARRHASFQALLARFGNKQVVDLKKQVLAAIDRGGAPSEISVPNDRFARSAVRVALRQARAACHPSASLAAWLRADDSRAVGGGADLDDAEEHQAALDR